MRSLRPKARYYQPTARVCSTQTDHDRQLLDKRDYISDSVVTFYVLFGDEWLTANSTQRGNGIRVQCAMNRQQQMLNYFLLNSKQRRAQDSAVFVEPDTPGEGLEAFSQLYDMLRGHWVHVPLAGRRQNEPSRASPQRLRAVPFIARPRHADSYSRL